jgi:hypothetical protein
MKLHMKLHSVQKNVKRTYQPQKPVAPKAEGTKAQKEGTAIASALASCGATGRERTRSKISRKAAKTQRLNQSEASAGATCPT